MQSIQHGLVADIISLKTVAAEFRDSLDAVTDKHASTAYHGSRKRSVGEIDELIAVYEDGYHSGLKSYDNDDDNLNGTIGVSLKSSISSSSLPSSSSSSSLVSSSSSCATGTSIVLEKETNLSNKKLKRTAAIAAATAEFPGEKRWDTLWYS